MTVIAEPEGNMLNISIALTPCAQQKTQTDTEWSQQTTTSGFHKTTAAANCSDGRSFQGESCNSNAKPSHSLPTPHIQFAKWNVLKFTETKHTLNQLTLNPPFHHPESSVSSFKHLKLEESSTLRASHSHTSTFAREIWVPSCDNLQWS